MTTIPNEDALMAVVEKAIASATAHFCPHCGPILLQGPLRNALANLDRKSS
jgi:hypothetical protein